MPNFQNQIITINKNKINKRNNKLMPKQKMMKITNKYMNNLLKVIIKRLIQMLGNLNSKLMKIRNLLIMNQKIVK